MKKLKKLLLLLAVVITTLVCFALSASAISSSGKCGANVNYTYNSSTGELVISGSGAMTDYEEWRSPFYKAEIKNVIIKSGVTTIGNYAFIYNESIMSVTIPSTVKTIGEEAFCCCDGLTSVTIPDSVTTIGEGAFACCESLKSVSIGKSVTIIDACAFDACCDLISITIPDSVKTIGDYAFSHCESLINAIIPYGVETIGEYAFGFCDILASPTVPSSVSAIGDGAFSGCPEITEIKLNSNNKCFTIGKHGELIDKEKTRLIWYPIGNKATVYNIPDSVTAIGEFTFYKCNYLKSITVPDSVTFIGDWAFYQCEGLKSASIGTGVTVMGNYAFTDCTNLTELYYGGTKEQWEKIKFLYGNDGLADIVHYTCSHINETVYPQQDATCTTSGYTAGTYCPDCEEWLDGHEVIPASHTDTNSDKFCDVCKKYTEELYQSGPFGENVTYEWYADGVVFINGTGPMTDFPSYNSSPFYRAEVNTVIVGEGITTVGKRTFFECKKLKNVTIPDSVTIIDDYAFANCDGLTSAPMGKNVTRIGECAFSECDNLVELTIGDKVTSIGELAFLFCRKLPSVTIPENVISIEDGAFEGCEKITNVTINGRIRTIVDNTFIGCFSLESVTIPDSVKSIGDRAFASSTGLTDVYFGGTETQWNNISIGEYNTYLTDATIHFAAHSHTDADSDKFCDECKEYTEELYKSGSCGENVTYKWYADGTVIISGEGAMTNYSSSSSTPFYNSNIKKVIIDDGVTSVGRFAFDCCQSLTDVIMGDDVTIIGWNAFEACNSLVNISLSNGLATIEGYAFAFCDSLSDILIPDTVTRIDDAAFIKCKSLKSITIPDGMSEINAYTFYYCKNLTSITIPDNVTAIGDYAFYGCDNLSGITVSDSVTTIGSNAFQNCYNLTDVYYAGTRNQWQEITIGSNNDYLTDATIHFNGCSHINATEHPQQNPTCASVGYTAGRYCIDCDMWLSGHEEIPAINHKNKETHPQYSPSCVAFGYTAGTYCPDCKTWLSGHEEIPFTGHSFTQYIYNGDATCTADGTKTAECDNCDEKSTLTAEGTKTDHLWGEWNTVKAPTCLENGTKERACKNCNASETGTLTATNHINKTDYPQQNPSCTSIGYTSGTYCPDCKTWLSGHKEIPFTGHSFTQYIYNGDATCTADGTKTAECDNCDEKSTLTAEGTKTDHLWGEWTVVDEPNCLDNGRSERICGRCASRETKITDPIRHINQKDYPQQNPTCASVGYTVGTYCPDCKTWLSGHEEIPAIGHSFTNYVSDENATILADGTKTAVCDYGCGNTDTIVVEGSKLAMATPSDLTATQTVSSITLTWSKAENATGYRIYYKLPGDLNWRVYVSYATGTTYTLKNLPVGQKYSFAVRSAYEKNDGSYILGGYTQIETATKAPAVSKIIAAQNTGAIKLTWNVCEGATGYRIYYKSGGVWKICVSTTNANFHIFTNLKAGSKYTFAVRPYIKNGSSVIWSDYIEFSTSTKPAELNVKLASPSAGKITLAWNAVNGADGYQVYYKTGDGSYKLYKVYSTAQNLTFSNLKSGTKYTFVVRAGIRTDGGNVFGPYTPVAVTVK